MLNHPDHLSILNKSRLYSLRNINLFYQLYTIFKQVTKQITMKESNFRMTMSLSQPYQSQYNFNRVKQNCQRIGITLTKFSDAQLEATYCMQGFKATGKAPNQICYIFISLFDEGVFPISSYFNGTLIQRQNLKKDSQISQFIKNSLQIVSQNFPKGKSIEEQYKQVERLFDNLNRKSEQILKSSNNEMMAIQQIKTSSEYSAICNHAKKVSEEVEQICNDLNSRSSKSKMKNQHLISSMLSVQTSKQQLQESVYQYTELLKSLNDVEGVLNRYISEKKLQVQSKDFYDLQSFSKYLEQLKALKRLQNQKKYLNSV